jgi:hypothetical protein
MPLQSQDSPLGAFLKALHEQEIKFILIGAMAAIEQGAPLMTVDYDFWIYLPERQYVRLLAIVQRKGGTIGDGEGAGIFFGLIAGMGVVSGSPGSTEVIAGRR